MPAISRVSQKFAFQFSLLCSICISVSLFGAELPAGTAPETAVEVQAKNYRSPLNAAVDLQYTPTSYTQYDWYEGITKNASGHGIRVGAEWIPFGEVPYGKPAVGVATGFHWFSRVGVVDSINADLYTVPIEPYFAYRLDIFEKQILVPFAKVGLNVTFLHQDTNTPDGAKDRSGTYQGFDYGFGGELNLSFIDRVSARNLENSTGINDTFLVFEYSKSRRLGADYGPDLSHEEYRLGLRFEI